MTTTVVAVALLATAVTAASAYEPITVKDGGTLTGVVRFVGTPPKLGPLAVNKNREVCGDSKPDEALVVGADGGVKGSVILIEGVARGKKSAGEMLLDNQGCLFVSHVSTLAVGDRARVKNSDAILHNTHAFAGKPTLFNLALPTREQVIDVTKRITKPGVVRVLCDAHPHMSAWIVVHDSPYLALTDDRGAFRITDVPPGSYRVTMWHEGFRARAVDKAGRPLHEAPHTATKRVTIAPGSTSTVGFELK